MTSPEDGGFQPDNSPSVEDVQNELRAASMAKMREMLAAREQFGDFCRRIGEQAPGEDIHALVFTTPLEDRAPSPEDNPVIYGMLTARGPMEAVISSANGDAERFKAYLVAGANGGVRSDTPPSSSLDQDHINEHFGFHEADDRYDYDRLVVGDPKNVNDQMIVRVNRAQNGAVIQEALDKSIEVAQAPKIAERARIQALQASRRLVNEIKLPTSQAPSSV